MLPKILRNDPRMRALGELTVEEMDTLRPVIKGLNVMNVYSVDISYLPWLAWWFRVDTWNDDWPEARQRDVVANALILYKYKGTIWAVQRALELSMFDAEVVPWYAMTPEGTRGTFKINATSAEGYTPTQDDYADCITLVESNKQGSQHWKMGIQSDPNDGLLFTPTIVRSRKRVVIETGS